MESPIKRLNSLLHSAYCLFKFVNRQQLQNRPGFKSMHGMRLPKGLYVDRGP